MKADNGIKQLDPGAAYVPSPQRQTRDMLEAFLNDGEVLDLMIDKLFKVLAGADMSKGFPKTDAFIFVQNYFIEHCQLPKLSEE